jgi:Integron cassette protein VCH_CASS1 chain
VPIHADDVQTLHRYADGVMGRVAHHAGNVGAIALALLGGIIWRADPGSIDIKQYDGQLANVVWWTSAATGTRYVCAYNHQTQEIEIGDRSTQGPVLHRFSNATPATTVEQIFATL